MQAPFDTRSSRNAMKFDSGGAVRDELLLPATSRVSLFVTIIYLRMYSTHRRLCMEQSLTEPFLIKGKVFGAIEKIWRYVEPTIGFHWRSWKQAESAKTPYGRRMSSEGNRVGERRSHNVDKWRTHIQLKKRPKKTTASARSKIQSFRLVCSYLSPFNSK